MRRVLALGLLAASACTGRTAPLSVQDELDQDARVADADLDGSVRDTGLRPFDAGPQLDATVPPPDAGVFDAGGNQCTAGPFSTGLTLLPDPVDFDAYSGLARISEVEDGRIGFEFPRGPTLLIRSRAPVADVVAPGNVVWVDYALFRSLWVDAAVAIRELAPSDGPGELRMVVWSLSPDSQPIDFGDIGLNVELEVAQCAPADLDGCGQSVTVDMLYRDRGVELRVPAGTERAVGNVQMGNGRSILYSEEPTCMSVPWGWLDGYIVVD